MIFTEIQLQLSVFIIPAFVTFNRCNIIKTVANPFLDKPSIGIALQIEQMRHTQYFVDLRVSIAFSFAHLYRFEHALVTPSVLSQAGLRLKNDNKSKVLYFLEPCFVIFRVTVSPPPIAYDINDTIVINNYIINSYARQENISPFAYRFFTCYCTPKYRRWQVPQPVFPFPYD